MWKVFPSQADDLLDVASLPPTGNTELNYRTRPLSSDQEWRLTLLLLLTTLPTLTLLGVGLHFGCFVVPGLRHAVVALGIILVGWIAWRRLTGAIQKHDVFFGLIFTVACGSALVWHWSMDEDFSSLRFGLLVGWVISSLIARQAAAWILAAPTVDHETTQRWRVNLPQVIPHGLSLDCPELLTYTVSPLLLALAWVGSLWILIWLGVGLWFWPFSFVASVQVVWLAWHLAASFVVPLTSPDESWRATWRALIVFLTYDIHHTPAAGVFRFPTRLLRSPWRRWALLVLTLAVIGFGYGTNCPSPHRNGQSWWIVFDASIGESGDD